VIRCILTAQCVESGVVSMSFLLIRCGRGWLHVIVVGGKIWLAMSMAAFSSVCMACGE
jgi:hypothetical protein